MTYPLSFLLSDEAARGRASRRDHYEAGTADLDTLAYVLHVERADGSFTEMDAESYTHAMTLGVSIVTHWANVASVAIRKVGLDGEVPSVERILDYRDAPGYEVTNHTNLLDGEAAA